MAKKYTYLYIFIGFLLTHSLQAQLTVKKFEPNLLQDHDEVVETRFSSTEIPVFETNVPNSVFLQNGYASAIIRNPSAWRPDYDSIDIVDITLVYTRYPLDKNKWTIGYHYLLNERLMELFRLDSNLNDAHINYHIALQTGCKNSKEAKTYKHGILISYKIYDAKTIQLKREQRKRLSGVSPHLQMSYRKDVEAFIKEQGGITDSTVYKIFDRHPEWRKSLVVMDWTSSMYQYGASCVLWHSLHYNTSGIRYFSFFNDGDNKPENLKKAGFAGGIYHEKADRLDDVIKLFRLVMKNGSGGDVPENDIEAMIKAIQYFPEFDELILIADNSACIRDYIISDSIKVPIKIILCGTNNGINPMYLNLAAKTGGSIHTIEEDIYSMQNSGIGQETVHIGGIDFKKDAKGLYIRIDGKMAGECEQFYDYKPEVKVTNKEKEKVKTQKKLNWWQRLWGKKEK